jgi:hypothetical protein
MRLWGWRLVYAGSIPQIDDIIIFRHINPSISLQVSALNDRLTKG